MPLMGALSLLLAAVLSIGADAPRNAALAGRVVDLAGQPVEGALVVAVHRAIPFSLEIEAVRREARTNAAGKFRLEVPPDLSFSVWAAWESGASVVEEGVMAGAWVDLAQDGAARATPVEVTGLDAWEAEGDLTFWVSAGCENFDLVPVELLGGRLVIPCLPHLERRSILVRDRESRTRWIGHTTLAAAGDLQLELPVLRSFRVRVSDEGGHPVAHAELRGALPGMRIAQHTGVRARPDYHAPWPVVGSTDARGEATVRLPQADAETTTVHLMARHPEYEASVSGWWAGKPFRNGKATRETGWISFDLRRAEPLQATLHLDSQPYRGAVSVAWSVAIEAANGIGRVFREPLAEIEDGSLSLARPSASAVWQRAVATLPGDVRGEIRERYGASAPSAVEVAAPGDGGTVALLERDGYHCVSVVTEDGRPAAGAVVISSPFDERGRFDGGAVFARTDRLGRALVPARAGGCALALTENEWGACWEELAADAAPTTIRLVPRPVLEGRVLDVTSKPVAHALVGAEHFRGYAGDAGEGVLPAPVAQSVFYHFGAVRTDGEGCFRLPLLPAHGAVSVQATVPGAQFGTSSPHWVPCAAEAAAYPDVELRVGVR